MSITVAELKQMIDCDVWSATNQEQLRLLSQELCRAFDALKPYFDDDDYDPDDDDPVADYPEKPKAMRAVAGG